MHYVEELYRFMDEKLGPGWKSRLDSEEVKAAIDGWIHARLGDALNTAIDEMPEEA